MSSYNTVYRTTGSLPGPSPAMQAYLRQLEYEESHRRNQTYMSARRETPRQPTATVSARQIGGGPPPVQVPGTPEWWFNNAAKDALVSAAFAGAGEIVKDAARATVPAGEIMTPTGMVPASKAGYVAIHPGRAAAVVAKPFKWAYGTPDVGTRRGAFQAASAEYREAVRQATSILKKQDASVALTGQTEAGKTTLAQLPAKAETDLVAKAARVRAISEGKGPVFVPNQETHWIRGPMLKVFRNPAYAKEIAKVGPFIAPAPAVNGGWIKHTGDFVKRTAMPFHGQGTIPRGLSYIVRRFGLGRELPWVPNPESAAGAFLHWMTSPNAMAAAITGYGAYRMATRPWRQRKEDADLAGQSVVTAPPEQPAAPEPGDVDRVVDAASVAQIRLDYQRTKDVAARDAAIERLPPEVRTAAYEAARRAQFSVKYPGMDYDAAKSNPSNAAAMRAFDEEFGRTGTNDWITADFGTGGQR